MDQGTTAPASAVIGHPAATLVAPDPRPWTIHRRKNGAPRWYQRWVEAWLVLSGRCSLHRAWQAGHDYGSRQEYRRIMVYGGDLGPIMDATIIATRARISGGSLPSDETLRAIRRDAWSRYKRDAQ